MSDKETSKYRIELNPDGIRELLSDETIRKCLEEQTNKITDVANAQVKHDKTSKPKHIGYVTTTAISNPAIQDGVNAFTQILKAVRDTFGEENMTEAVMCSAIAEGGYAFWRSVMGGKYPDEQEQRKRRVL